MELKMEYKNEFNEGGSTIPILSYRADAI